MRPAIWCGCRQREQHADYLTGTLFATPGSLVMLDRVCLRGGKRCRRRLSLRRAIRRSSKLQKESRACLADACTSGSTYVEIAWVLRAWRCNAGIPETANISENALLESHGSSHHADQHCVVPTSTAASLATRFPRPPLAARTRPFWQESGCGRPRWAREIGSPISAGRGMRPKKVNVRLCRTDANQLVSSCKGAVSGRQAFEFFV